MKLVVSYTCTEYTLSRHSDLEVNSENSRDIYSAYKGDWRGQCIQKLSLIETFLTCIKFQDNKLKLVCANGIILVPTSSKIAWINQRSKYMATEQLALYCQSNTIHLTSVKKSTTAELSYLLDLLLFYMRLMSNWVDP